MDRYLGRIDPRHACVVADWLLLMPYPDSQEEITPEWSATLPLPDCVRVARQPSRAMDLLAKTARHITNASKGH
jgi:hypothetical protein